MALKALVIDQDALHVLDAALVENQWFEQFLLPPGTRGLRRVVIGDVVYLLSDLASESSGLLVVQVEGSGIFDEYKNLRYKFDRIIRVGLRHFSREITIPIQWQLFHKDAMISVYAEPIAKKTGKRLYFHQAPKGSTNLFVYGLVDGAQDFAKIEINWKPYEEAVEGFEDALLTDAGEPEKRAGNFGIILSQPIGAQFTNGVSLSEWYEKKLTTKQRDFVDRSHNAPVRLRGAAGTGKTQALTVKCLRDLYRFEYDGYDGRVALLTHSSALAHDVIRGIFYGMDPSAKWQHLKKAQLYVGTLYEFAQETLQYERKGLEPLSLDGRDGRELQRMLIAEAIDGILKDPRFALDVMPRCSRYFLERIKDPKARGAFIEALMNEFACVLDAENIQKGTPEAAKYISASRERWQMELPQEYDRRAVLDIYERYNRSLQQSKLLSMDQMIADFNRYLLTHEWRQLRESKGFDLIFVDEYHYFNKSEVMTFHYLFRSRAERNGKLPLFMSYDLKQSPTDVALSWKRSAESHFQAPKAGKTELVELKEIFRATPQISAFLRDLDGSFPAIGLEDEWDVFDATSNQIEGDRPELWIFSDSIKLLDNVFKQAEIAAMEAPEGGRQVAVLCMNEDLFDQYRELGRIEGKFVALTSRDQLGDLRYAKKKCIFSMPEYVAGLQFDTVFLIHLDQAELADAFRSVGYQRRLVSRSYLGASRAGRRLVVAASSDRGGPNEILKGPLANHTILRVDK